MLIDGKSFFDMPIKNDEETYEQVIEMVRNNDYTTGNLLDYEYFSKNYKLSAIDLDKQIELEKPDLKQQILLEVLKEMKEPKCFLSLKSQKKQLLNLNKMLQRLFDFDHV